MTKEVQGKSPELTTITTSATFTRMATKPEELVTMKIRTNTRTNLRRIAADSGESIVEVIERLAQTEAKRLKVKAAK